VSTDSEIIERSRDSPGAFAELYDHHAAAIYRYAARRIGPDHADDVMSETFLVAFERRAAFDLAIGDALPWLYGIATTLIRKHARLEAVSWKGTTAAAGAAQIAADDIEDLETRVDAHASITGISSALKRMAQKDRDVLLLHAWADLSYDGIAQALGIPIGTVRSRLNRARQQLRTAINRDTRPDTEVKHGRSNPAAQNAQ
jgi:RNA polymerase sigma factor (sigma-70 family)